MKHNFDIICLSETDLDSSIKHDDEKLHLNGYKVATTENSNPNSEQVNAGWARTATWWRNDTVTTEDTKIDSITASYGFRQITFDPTHILTNSSCIDLIFTN